MSYPPYGQPTGPHPQQPYGSQLPAPVPYGYMPVQMVQVKERAFNPVTFGVHACLWIFLHSWLTVLSFGLWLFAAIPLTFIGWTVMRTVPVQQMPPGYPPRPY